MAKGLDIGIATVVSAVISAAATYAVAKSTDNPEPRPTFTVSPSAAPKPTVHLGNLTNGQTVSPCYTAAGNATLAGDQTVILGAHAEGDPRWYWEGNATWDPSNTRWSIRTTFGDVNNPAQYSLTVTVIIVNKPFAEYLQSTNSDYPTETWWSSTNKPPSALAEDGVVVTRIGNAGGKSC